MNKLFLVLFLIFTFPAFVFSAGEIDIPTETRQDVNKAKQGTIIIHPATKTVIVTMQHGYIDSEFVSTREIRIIWQDIVDNPDTPEDETSTKFTEFMSHLDKPAIKIMIEAEY